MKIGPLAILAATLSSSLPALAYTGACAGNEIDVSLSITTNDRGQITELLLKTPGTSPVRYPEANATVVIPSSFSMTFVAKETPSHQALELNIAGKSGHMRLGDQSTTLECDWN